MCYIYKDNQKSAYIQNIYWVYADYIRQLFYERTFSVPSPNGSPFLLSVYVVLKIFRIFSILVSADISFLTEPYYQ